MDYLELLKQDLGKGYSKADLERLIGLPRNSLSGILAGNKVLSKKSMVKIDLWEASEKPDPLKLHFVKKQVKENNKPENKSRILAERNTPHGLKFAQPNPKAFDAVKIDNITMDEAGQWEEPNNSLISQYEEELKHLGKSSLANQRRKFLEKKMAELKSKL